MRKGKYLKSAVTAFVFLLVSSAAVPVSATDYTVGDGAISNGIEGTNTTIGENATTGVWTSTAIGTSAYSAQDSAAVGYKVISGGASSTAAGSSANAGGSFAVAIGYNSHTEATGVAIGASSQVQVNGCYNTGSNSAIGAGATIADSSQMCAVIGKDATASDTGGTAAGAGAKTTSNRSAAYGYGAAATASYSTAIGAGASATATKSVALGAGSVADRANTVSVGSAGNERQITNVADGTAATDVINVRQLNGLGQKIDKVGAMAAAISGLKAMPRDPKAPLQVLAGFGTYSGRQAVAVGVGYYAHEKFLLKFGMAFCGSEKMGQVGLEWKWGRSGKKAMAAPGGDSTVTALQATARQLQDQLKQQQDQTQKQQDQQQDQIKQLQDQIEQLLLQQNSK